MAADKQTIKQLQSQVETLTADKKTLESTVADLKKKPADTTAHVVEDKKNDDEPTGIGAFVNTRCEAQSLYDMIP